MSMLWLNCDAAYFPEPTERLVNIAVHVIGIFLNLILFLIVSNYSGKCSGPFKSVFRITCASDICVSVVAVIEQQVGKRMHARKQGLIQ